MIDFVKCVRHVLSIQEFTLLAIELVEHAQIDEQADRMNKVTAMIVIGEIDDNAGCLQLRIGRDEFHDLPGQFA